MVPKTKQDMFWSPPGKKCCQAILIESANQQQIVDNKLYRLGPCGGDE